MRERIVFQDNDRIAVIAPHPDDECLGTAAVLLLAPERTDIFVLTDGSHGNPEKSIEEEAEIRRKQFEAARLEMARLRGHDPSAAAGCRRRDRLHPLHKDLSALA